MNPPSDRPAETPAAPPGSVAVRFEHTSNFAALLQQLQATLLISTYQAGKLVVVGVHEGTLAFSFHSFEQAMGLAVSRERIAVGTRRLVWTLRAAHDLGPRIKPAGKYDGCFLARSAHVTGEIHVHELAWAGDELWIVNTLFSCLCTLSEGYHFVPRWRPPFVTALAAEDRCHLNGFVLEAGQPRLATVMAETDTPGGWRPNKATTGCLIDVPSGAVLARGFAMPHSPRLHQGRVWVLDSGKGLLTGVDLASGRVEPVAQLMGYTRGLALHGPFAFVGLSKIRETSVFGGIPIAERRDQLKCGVAVVDLRTGRQIAALDFHSGVDEIFDVQILPGMRLPAVNGPNPAGDGGEPIWLVPTPGPAPRAGP